LSERPGIKSMPYETTVDPGAGEVSPGLRDGDIILHVRQGNLAQAFEMIMQRYQAKVYRLCVAYLRDPVRAQDCAQDSLIRLWRALPKYDDRAALSTWIYAITRNRCLTCLSRRRESQSLSEPAIRLEVDAVAEPDQHEAHDQRNAIRQLVDELPDAIRRVVCLFYFEEQSVAQVADLLGLPEGTIKTHLFRARARLLSRLDAIGLADPASWTTIGG
jgi:RNA polymerase sigma-70 factor (ECF subfamily)